MNNTESYEHSSESPMLFNHDSGIMQQNQMIDQMVASFSESYDGNSWESNFNTVRRIWNQIPFNTFEIQLLQVGTATRQVEKAYWACKAPSICNVACDYLDHSYNQVANDTNGCCLR